MTRIEVFPKDRILQRESVNHGCQHAHMIRGDAVHIARLFSHSAKKIPAPHDDGDLHSQSVYLADFASDLVDSVHIYSEALSSRQGLTREFQKDTLKNGRHVLSV